MPFKTRQMSRHLHSLLRCAHDKATQTSRAVSLCCHRPRSKRGDYATPRAQRCKRGCWNLGGCSRCRCYCSFLYSPASLYSANRKVDMAQKYPTLGASGLVAAALRPLASVKRRMQLACGCHARQVSLTEAFKDRLSPIPVSLVISEN